MNGKHIYIFSILSLLGLSCESSYKKKNGKVYYNKREITVLDINSFESINDVFARDNKTGYYRGRPVKGSGEGFKALNEHYAVDNKHAFYCDYYRDGKTYYTTKIDIVKIIPGADISTLKTIADEYAKDEHSVYYKAEPFKVADVSSFALLSNNFAKDNIQAYYYLTPIPYSDGVSFEVINGTYAKDNKHVYYSYVLHDNTTDSSGHAPSTLIADADPASFKALSITYAKDKNHAYYLNKPIKESDVTTFKADSAREDEYASDASHIYFYGKIIDKPDLKTFTPLDEGYAKDQQHVYYETFKIIGSDPSSFIVLEQGYAKDKAAVYYKGVMIKQADPASFETFGLNAGGRDAKDSRYEYLEGKRTK